MSGYVANVEPNDMATTSKWLSETMDKIAKFREDQESSLLATFSLTSNYSNNLMNRNAPAVYQSKMILNNKNNKDSIEFFDLIDQSILIVASSITNSSCWPLALITLTIGVTEDKKEKTVDLGTLDSHGSLWKMILRPDAYPGTRVILQTNEIGDTPAFLRADLTFHDSIEVAAVWTVYTVSNINQTTDNSNDELSNMSKLPHDGTIVRFELFEGPAGGYGIKSEARYLVSVISKSMSKGIALMTEAEIKEETKDKDLSFGIQWELIAENVEIIDQDIDQALSGTI